MDEDVSTHVATIMDPSASHRADITITLNIPAAITAIKVNIDGVNAVTPVAADFPRLGALLLPIPIVIGRPAITLVDEQLLTPPLPVVIDIGTTPTPIIHAPVISTATSVIATTHIVTATIMTAAMFMTPVPVTVVGGLLTLPLPTAASLGGGPVVVAVVHGCVNALPPTSGGGSGARGIRVRDDTTAAASTTGSSLAITTTIIIPSFPTTSRSLVTSFLLPGDAHAVTIDGSRTLLPMVMVNSGSSSVCGRGRTSGGPRRDRRFLAHSPPPSAATVERAARHGIGRPSAFVNAALTTMPPRPGPASLLASSMQPQQGRITQRGSRVGEPLRAAVAASA